MELGHREECLEWGRKARALGPDDPYVLYGIACLFARLGEKDEAADHFAHAVRSGFRNRRWMESDPDLDAIRDHPRFRTAVAAARR